MLKARFAPFHEKPDKAADQDNWIKSGAFSRAGRISYG